MIKGHLPTNIVIIGVVEQEPTSDCLIWHRYQEVAAESGRYCICYRVAFDGGLEALYPVQQAQNFWMSAALRVKDLASVLLGF